MSTPHFNLQTMTDYRKDALKRGYNPFDYPEEWEFFKHPFEEDEVEKDHTSFENEKKQQSPGEI